MNTLEQAKKLLESGDIDQARKLLLGMTRSTPDDISIWILLCGISTRTQDWELGVISFGRLAKLCPASSLATSGLVQSYVNLDRHKEAIYEIERFKSVLDPSSDEARIVMKEHNRIEELIAERGGTNNTND